MTDHLGGHLGKNHVDYGALDYLIQKYDLKSYLDIGCGPPWMVEYARDLGLTALGIDGDPVLFPNPLITQNDYTLGHPKLDQNYDLGWSVEFLEHVEEQYLPNVFNSFSHCKYVVCTHATEVGNGHHHVNCQDEDYWIAKFAEYGFEYDEAETQTIRLHSTMVKKFLSKTGKFFINRKLAV